MKTQICDLSVSRSPTIIEKLKKLYDIVKFEKGDILNIIQGSTELSIVTNERYKKQFIEILQKEKILNIEENLISLTMTFLKKIPIHTWSNIQHNTKCSLGKHQHI